METRVDPSRLTTPPDQGGHWEGFREGSLRCWRQWLKNSPRSSIVIKPPLRGLWWGFLLCKLYDRAKPIWSQHVTTALSMARDDVTILPRRQRPLRSVSPVLTSHEFAPSGQCKKTWYWFCLVTWGAKAHRRVPGLSFGIAITSQS